MKKFILTILCLLITSISLALDPGFKLNNDPNFVPDANYYYNEYEYVIDHEVPWVQDKKNYDEVLSHLDKLLMLFGNEGYYEVFTPGKKYWREQDAYNEAIVAYVKVKLLKAISNPNTEYAKYLKNTVKYEDEQVQSYMIVEELNQMGKNSLVRMVSKLTTQLDTKGAFNNDKLVDLYVQNLYCIIKVDSSYKYGFFPHMIKATKYNDPKEVSKADIANGKKGDSVIWTTFFVKYVLGF